MVKYMRSMLSKESRVSKHLEMMESMPQEKGDRGREEGKKGAANSMKWIYILLIYILIAGCTLLWCFSFDVLRLKGQLVSVIPWFLEVNFLLIVVGAGLSIRGIREVFKGLTKKQWTLALSTALLGVILAMFVAPRVHRIFYDENIYLNIGQTIAAQKKAAMCAEGYNSYGQYRCIQLEHNKQPYAYPHVISIIYRIFGYSETAGFILNNLLFGAAVFTSFLIGWLLFGNFLAGISSSLLYCLIPENIIWANTTAVETSAALFAGLAMASALIYIRRKGVGSLLLTAILMSYAAQFRVESLFVFPLVFLLLFLYNRATLKRASFYWILALALALLMPHFVQLYAVRGESWGSAGDRMGLSFFLHNLSTNSVFYVNDTRFPLLFTLLLFLGVFWKDDGKARAFLGTWLLLFWGVFLLFYAGSYDYGQDVRFSVVSYMPLALLSGKGLANLLERFRANEKGVAVQSIVLMAILFCFTSFMPHIRTVGEEACQARADHFYAKRMIKHIPENAMVLTHNPNMFLLWGKNAAQAAIATNDHTAMNHFFERYTGGIFFHHNYWCNTDDPREQASCRNVLEKYRHSVIVEYSEKGYRFILYRIEKKLS